jgi:hypothetical protein
LPEDELFVAAKELQAPYELVREVAQAGKLPVVLFTAGGIATPADAAMMMQLGAEGVFVGVGHLQVRQPRAARRGDRQGDDLLRRPGRDRQGLARLGEAMVGINVEEIAQPQPSAAGEASGRRQAVPLRGRSAGPRAALTSRGRSGPGPDHQDIGRSLVVVPVGPVNLVEAMPLVGDALLPNLEEFRQGWCVVGRGRSHDGVHVRDDPSVRREWCQGGERRRSDMTMPTIGVLGVQGDVREHLAALAAVGVQAIRVRRPRRSTASTGS